MGGKDGEANQEGVAKRKTEQLPQPLVSGSILAPSQAMAAFCP